MHACTPSIYTIIPTWEEGKEDVDVYMYTSKG